MSELPSDSPGWVRVLAGVFVLWQLVFLVTANFTNFLEGEGRLNDPQSRPVNVMLNLQRLMHTWSDATLQRESWGLFRAVPTKSVFPAVELTWSDSLHREEKVLLRSFEEPDDPEHFLQLNPLHDRLHNHEAWLTLIYDAWEERAAIADSAQREESLRDLIRAWYRPLWAYLQWRIEQHRLEHPAAPTPTEAILLWRMYPTPSPGEPGPPGAPIRREVARWRAGRQLDSAGIPLEVFDPQGKCYIEVTPQR